MIRTKSIDQIVERAIGYLEQNTDVTLLTPGSTARALIDALSSEVAGLYTILDRAMMQAFVSSASGVFLDLLGEMVGVQRRSETAAFTAETDQNIRFYVTTGVLRDYLSSIPTGTVVTSIDRTIVFVVDGDTTIPTNATEIFVTARAQTVGADSAVGPGILVSHGLSQPNVFVTNTDAITTSSGVEDDASMRYRIRYAVRTAEGSNQLAVRMAALGVPGVSDIIVNPFSMGSGSFEIIILPQGNRVPLSTISGVRTSVAQAVSFGINFQIREPRYVPISVVAEVLSPSVPNYLQEQIRSSAAQSIRRYVGQLRPGDTMVINRIREAVLATDTRITDVTLREVRVNRRPILLSNYLLKPDELFIPDPEEAEPFAVR